jgi:hypothetical protein
MDVGTGILGMDAETLKVLVAAPLAVLTLALLRSELKSSREERKDERKSREKEADADRAERKDALDRAERISAQEQSQHREEVKSILDVTRLGFEKMEAAIDSIRKSLTRLHAAIDADSAAQGSGDIHAPKDSSH